MDAEGYAESYADSELAWLGEPKDSYAEFSADDLWNAIKKAYEAGWNQALNVTARAMGR